MRSSNQVYLSNLDHLRGFAAFLVFTWHFMHHHSSCPSMCYATAYSALVTLPFFTFLEQGHTGVALFLCISGYIFTRLAHGRRIRLLGFWQNRILRLFPLILFVGLLSAIYDFHAQTSAFTWAEIKKHIRTLFHPGGSWTIYLELRYYAVLPLLQFAMRKTKPLAFIATILAITLTYRAIIWHLEGSVQFPAYWRLTGRMDQFMAGSAAFYVELWVMQNYSNARRILQIGGIASLVILLTIYHYFSLFGGYYAMGGNPSVSRLWVFLPLIEGLCYSALIVAYLTVTMPRLLDTILSALGRWSYSIYLNHFLLVPFIFSAFAANALMPDEFYKRLALGTFIVFPIISAISAATYRFVERPFLRLRRPYLVPLAESNNTKSP